MKWETKDKLQKTGMVLFIIGFMAIVGWGYENCQRSVVKKAIYNGWGATAEGVCNKLSSKMCFRSSVGRAADL